MRPEIYERIKEIAEYHSINDIDREVLNHKILMIAYQVEYDNKTSAIEDKIKQISSTCNDKLK